MQTRKKGKADQTVIGICIILSSIWKSTGCLRQGVTNCGFRKLIRHNLREKVCNFNFYGIDAVKTNAFFLLDDFVCFKYNVRTNLLTFW